jgi:hypothetical protein
MRATDSFYGRLAVNGDTQAVEGSAVSYLSRRLALDSFAIAVRGDRLAQQWRGAMNGPRALIVLPTMAPIVLMMTGDPAVGREASYEVYNPQVRKIQRMTFRILAESLFTVSDSSAFDSTTARWVSAHRDTVRAWSVAPHASGFTVWVDAQGRVVSGSAPAGLRIERAAYEETFSNWRKEHQ